MKYFSLFFLLGSLAGAVEIKTLKTEKAVFAGGCFWSMESYFEKIKGVLDVVSGYTGGEANTAIYEKVAAGGTGHREAIEVTYDPATVSYDKLVENYFKTIDPFDDKGQFCDKGDSYKTAIYVSSESEKKIAEEKLNAVAISKPKFGKVATEITFLRGFYPAEDYHQDYHKKNPIRYNYYKYRCGRDERLKTIGL